MEQTVVCLVMLITHVAAFEFGNTYNDCVDMNPTLLHERGYRILPQTGPAPFDIIVSKTNYRGVDSIKVKLQATTTRPIVGFLIQARRYETSLDRDEPIGTFVPQPGTTITTCNTASGNAIKNSGPMVELSVEVTWTSSSSQGHLQFRATIVTPNGVYWVAERSPIVIDVYAQPLTSTIPPSDPPARAAIDFDIEQCGDNYGCYRYPSDCKTDCDMIVMWKTTGDLIHFKLGGASGGWVAVGFSDDKKMGNDEVVECAWIQKQVEVRQSENEADKKSNIITRNKGNLGDILTSRTGGRVECAFTFRKNAANSLRLTDSYHILLAKGEVNEQGEKMRHTLEPGKYPYVSPYKVDLIDTPNMGSTARYALVKVHGIFMLIAWMMCAFPAVLLAKYYKPMWPNDNICGEKVWFAFHRGLNLANLFCTILAFILIFVHVGGYSTLPDLPGKAHPILGIIVTILCILNPLIALCRPGPKSKSRPIFNWFHWFFGLVAIALATPALFIGLNLHKAFVPWWATWVMVAFMLFHLVVELMLEIHGCLNARKQRMRDDEFEISKRTDARGEYRGLLPEPVGTRFKKNILTIYGIVVVILGVIMVIAVAAG